MCYKITDDPVEIYKTNYLQKSKRNQKTLAQTQLYSIDCRNRLRKMFVLSMLTLLKTGTTGHPTFPTDSLL